MKTSKANSVRLNLREYFLLRKWKRPRLQEKNVSPLLSKTSWSCDAHQSISLYYRLFSFRVNPLATRSVCFWEPIQRWQKFPSKLRRNSSLPPSFAERVRFSWLLLVEILLYATEALRIRMQIVPTCTVSDTREFSIHYVENFSSSSICIWHTCATNVPPSSHVWQCSVHFVTRDTFIEVSNFPSASSRFLLLKDNTHAPSSSQHRCTR